MIHWKADRVDQPQVGRPRFAPEERILTAIQQLLEAYAEHVADLVHERIVESGPAPQLVDSNTLASMWGLSTATIKKLTRRGMPFVLAGSSKRFVPAEALAWLREHDSSSESVEE